MRGLVLACVLGGSLGAAACLLELDDAIACGDGYIDRAAGEECDPADLDDIGARCNGRGGGCDPVTCQEQCCGDREVNGDEECDGIDLGLVGVGGVTDGGETCRNLTVPGTNVPYASGDATCTSECRIDRSECTLCGNGQVDPELMHPDGTMLPAEKCDGGQVRLEELWTVCAPACDLPSSSVVTCNATCNGCRLITVSEPVNCCFPKGAQRIDERYPCCCELDPRGCELPISPGDVEPVCPAAKTS